MTYKQKKLLQMHQSALSTSVGHNASHLRTDTVVHSLADSMNLNKRDIVDVESGDVAVRVALGEAKVLEENKLWCLEHGVDLDALDSHSGSAIKRSSTVILVKNLPYSDSTKGELLKIFGRFSDAIEVLLPPSKSLALIKFSHRNDAKKAFKRIAYKRFMHVPLYLEWPALSNEDSISIGDEATQIKSNTSVGNGDNADEDEAESQTVYVKNLNFNTTEDQLLEIFRKVVSVRSVRIPKKNFASNADTHSTKSLSMGYGFVECSTLSDAKIAIKVLDGKTIQGHSIILKMSNNEVKTFQATRKELFQIFGNYGQLKKVRLPKKFDGTPRGFAFVDFVTHNEAVNAMQGLSKTHLYGRHLVLEWAEKEESISDLRDKAKRDRTKSKVTELRQNKKIRFDQDEY
mmetsp:Transcript_21995/g.28297  ORF Transcript_21995/g.28297 Transcript_21995/m.28297 type:complete len:402 (-) Transcript_21995:1148-2353(-)